MVALLSSCRGKFRQRVWISPRQRPETYCRSTQVEQRNDRLFSNNTCTSLGFLGLFLLFRRFLFFLFLLGSLLLFRSGNADLWYLAPGFRVTSNSVPDVHSGFWWISAFAPAQKTEHKN